MHIFISRKYLISEKACMSGCSHTFLLPSAHACTLVISAAWIWGPFLTFQKKTVMATSSSDEGSIPPKDFQQFSSSTDSGSRLSPNRKKCPLCLKFRKTFHCRECVQSGLFVSSILKTTDR